MKKLYTLLFSFLWLLGFSQNTILSDADWRIEKIRWNNIDYLPPSMPLISAGIKFDNPNPIYTGNYYNTVTGNFKTDDTGEPFFYILSHAVTLWIYNGKNQ